MMKLTSQIVLGKVSSIIFEDFLIDVGAWREVSVQVLVGNNNVFLSGNETFHFYSERCREKIYTHWVKLDEERSILSTSCFASNSQFGDAVVFHDK